jgi:methyl-accepting chemotaxis protein
MINEISHATQEQEKNSSQLFAVVENMQELSSQVSHATEEQQKKHSHVTNFMEDVQLLVEENVQT